MSIDARLARGLDQRDIKVASRNMFFRRREEVKSLAESFSGLYGLQSYSLLWQNSFLQVRAV
jgi:hypothetical protein